MRSFFNAENWLWKPLGALGDLVVLSLLWTVFSVPVVTIGPASAALYDAAVHSIRRREDTVIARFLTAFRREVKQGIVTTLIALAAGALIFFAPLLVFNRQDAWPFIFAAWWLLGFFLLCVLCWLFPALSRFTMGTGPLLSASLRLAFGHILRSVPMAALWAVALWAGLRFIAPFFVCPALAALLCSRLIEPIFKKYE